MKRNAEKTDSYYARRKTRKKPRMTRISRIKKDGKLIRRPANTPHFPCLDLAVLSVPIRVIRGSLVSCFKCFEEVSFRRSTLPLNCYQESLISSISSNAGPYFDAEAYPLCSAFRSEQLEATTRLPAVQDRFIKFVSE